MHLEARHLFWPGLAILFLLPTLIFIPREEYKKYFIFGFVLGGLVDILTILVIGDWFGEFSYYAGPFMVSGIPIFIPLAFTFVWMIFLYFLPFRMEFLIPYIICFSWFSILVGLVEQNLGYFKFHKGFVRGALLTAVIFFAWFSVSAWIFRKYLPKLPAAKK
jgi:hypothetical protein